MTDKREHKKEQQQLVFMGLDVRTESIITFHCTVTESAQNLPKLRPEETSHKRMPHLIKDGLIGGTFLHGRSDLIKIFCPSQLCVSVGIQQTKVAVKLAPVISGQFCANTVECNVKRSPICLQQPQESLVTLYLTWRKVGLNDASYVSPQVLSLLLPLPERRWNACSGREQKACLC